MPIFSRSAIGTTIEALTSRRQTIKKRKLNFGDSESESSHLYPLAFLVLAGIGVAAFSSELFAGPREQAYRLHSRIAGVPPDPDVHDQMSALIQQGKAFDAALLATDHADFLRTTVKNFASSWTNIDLDPRARLNDYSATAIGLVRDNRPFHEILWDNVIYVPGDGAINHPDSARRVDAYSNTSNTGYSRPNNGGLEYDNHDLRDPTILRRAAQTEFRPDTPPAGFVTTRAAADAYFTAGTNRAMWRALTRTYLCRDMEQLFDTTIPDTYVRGDVDRAPGGDPAIYKSRCMGCHSVMDPFANAYVKYDFFDNRIQHSADTNRPDRFNDTPGISDKINDPRRVLFEAPKVTSDVWRNLVANRGHNQSLGWRQPMGGHNNIYQGEGAASLGKTIAALEAFSECMSERVFKHVCLRKPNDAEKEALLTAARWFERREYKMRDLFAHVGTFCMGK